MAVDARWLAQIREKNRRQFGMAGLGQESQDIAATLQSVRAARTAQGISDKERSAELAAREVMARDPRSAALLTMPEVYIPEAKPIPKELLIGAGILAAGLLGLLIVQTFRS